MPDAEQTSAQIIIDEIRRQVDHQVTAADALDTKAMATFGGAAAVAAFVAPRVTVDSGTQAFAALATFGLLIVALICLLLAVRPRVGGFSNGPNVVQLAERVDNAPSSLERELAQAFVGVRNNNEGFLKSKGGWMIKALWFLILTVIGIAVMVGVGAIA